MELPTIHSQRAQGLLEKCDFQLAPPSEKHGKCQYDDGRLVWWRGNEICEGWGYSEAWNLPSKALLEAAGVLILKKNWSKIQEISVRELEYFLRDKNSQVAISDNFLNEFAPVWTEIQQAVQHWRHAGVSLQDYHFSKVIPFKDLPLAEKIHELKSFFLSKKLAPFYQRGGQLEVVDVSDCTVYLALQTGEIPQGAFLDWLQIIACEEFQEPTLNLLPE